MKERERLDKIVVHTGAGSRKQVRQMVRAGEITVNGETAVDPGLKINPFQDQIAICGETIVFREFIYLMMNKPPGVLSATEDARLRTVIELLTPSLRHFRPFPVGRLDKDTTGLLLLTNDGKLAHELLTPKNAVEKGYEAIVTGEIHADDIRQFREGVTLDDGYKTLPAKLEPVYYDRQAHRSTVRVTLTEGKFHQVKRMFIAVGKKVIALQRQFMGPLRLDESLAPGQYRELREEEITALKSAKKRKTSD